MRTTGTNPIENNSFWLQNCIKLIESRKNYGLVLVDAFSLWITGLSMYTYGLKKD